MAENKASKDMDLVVAFVQDITGGMPAGVADIAESLKNNNFSQLKAKLGEMGLPLNANLDEKRKWWSENWRDVRSYSINELKNNLLENPDKPIS